MGAFCGLVLPPSHRLTVAKETPSFAAKSAWVRSSLPRINRNVAGKSSNVMFAMFAH